MKKTRGGRGGDARVAAERASGDDGSFIVTLRRCIYRDTPPTLRRVDFDPSRERPRARGERERGPPSGGRRPASEHPASSRADASSRPPAPIAAAAHPERHPAATHRAHPPRVARPRGSRRGGGAVRLRLGRGSFSSQRVGGASFFRLGGDLRFVLLLRAAALARRRSPSPSFLSYFLRAGFFGVGASSRRARPRATPGGRTPEARASAAAPPLGLRDTPASAMSPAVAVTPATSPICP